jgi:uncharacterized protein YggE
MRTSRYRMRLMAAVLSIATLVIAGRVWLMPVALQAGSSIPAAQAQEAGLQAQSGITVLGDGAARSEPDLFTVRFSVQMSAKTPREALFQAREASERLLQLMRDRGVPDSDIQTSGLSVFPVHAAPREGTPDPGAIAGYRGHAVVTLQVEDPRKLSMLLDAALQGGATAVQGISYGLRDDSALRRQALQAALSGARPKAEAVAAAAGLTITGVRAVIEQPVGPPRPFGGGGLGGSVDGIAPGELTVVVRVQVTYDVQR